MWEHKQTQVKGHSGRKNVHCSGEKRSISTSNCLQQLSVSLTASSIDSAIVHFSYIYIFFPAWLRCSLAASRWRRHCADKQRGLMGSQRTDLGPLKINTVGCRPSGFCRRLHSLKSSPDPGCSCVTALAPKHHMVVYILLL